MQQFNDAGLPLPLTRALEKMNFTTPTPIQTQAVPPALLGRDILGSAQTGTGKTAAFGIPLVAHLLNNPQSNALVMTPTRELAVQVLATLKQLLGDTHLTGTLLIGGESMYKQLQLLKSSRPRLIVGTPGRINDHLERKSLKLQFTDFLVLDETDRMLDMGFEVQIERIIKHLPTPRQTLMFSATMPANIVRMSAKYLNDPLRIAVGSTTTAAPKIKQEIVRTSQGDKYNTLVTQLLERDGSIIVFVKTKRGADRLADKLHKAQHSASAIHGDLRQSQRDRVIRDFREKKRRILVATDVAARGLDIPHIEHVINYDLPQVAEDYIHRIGRTARAGAEGSAVALLTPDDGGQWKAIQRLMNPGEKQEGDYAPRRPARSGSGKPYAGKPGGGYRAKPYKGKEGGSSEGGQNRFKPRHKGGARKPGSSNTSRNAA